MITVRRSAARGHFDHGWLDTRHSFSFGEYFDPAQMGFRALRVINEDVVAPGTGFPTHPHRDMEILTYVLEGAVAHRDSTGAEGLVQAGDVQAMTAGKGVRHSEFNPSPAEPLHLLQIWIEPARTGSRPTYSQSRFSREEKLGRLRLIAGPDGAEGALQIGADARVFGAVLTAGTELVHPLAPGRHAWVQVVRGRVLLSGLLLEAGDGASLSGEARVTLAADEETELLLFDLA